jgi:hypothetical protein
MEKIKLFIQNTPSVIWVVIGYIFVVIPVVIVFKCINASFTGMMDQLKSRKEETRARSDELINLISETNTRLNPYQNKLTIWKTSDLETLILDDHLQQMLNDATALSRKMRRLLPIQKKALIKAYIESDNLIRSCDRTTGLLIGQLYALNGKIISPTRVPRTYTEFYHEIVSRAYDDTYLERPYVTAYINRLWNIVNENPLLK